MAVDLQDWVSAASQPGVLAGTITLAAGGDNQSLTFTTPTGMQSIAVALPGAASEYDSLIVIGQTTGIVYYTQVPKTDVERLYFFPVPAELEGSWTVNVITNATQPVQRVVRVGAVFASTGVVAIGQPGLPINVKVSPPLTRTTSAKPEVRPELQNAVVLTAGNPAWVQGAWVELVPVNTIVGRSLGHVYVNMTGGVEAEIEIGTGGAGAEQAIGKWVCSGEAPAAPRFDSRDILVIPPIVIVDNARVAGRLMANLGAITASCKLGLWPPGL